MFAFCLNVVIKDDTFIFLWNTVNRDNLFTLRIVNCRKLAGLDGWKKKIVWSWWKVGYPALHSARILFRFDKFETVAAIFILVTETIFKRSRRRISLAFLCYVNTICLHSINNFPILIWIPVGGLFTPWIRTAKSKMLENRRVFNEASNLQHLMVPWKYR